MIEDAEKQNIVSELKIFYKKLRSYQNRQNRRVKGDKSEAKDRSLNALRLELQREHGRLENIISKYAGTIFVQYLGTNYPAFPLALETLNMKHLELHALEASISLVNKAVGKLDSLSQIESAQKEIEQTETPKAFIAHGGETEARNKLQKYLIALGVQPLIIEEESAEGRSVNQQVKHYLNQASCSIILGTADDKELKDGKLYPRRNVYIEIGRFQEKFPSRIIYLLEKGASFPSDISEKLYTRFTQDNMEKAFLRIAIELKAFGILKTIKP